MKAGRAGKVEACAAADQAAPDRYLTHFLMSAHRRLVLWYWQVHPDPPQHFGVLDAANECDLTGGLTLAMQPDDLPRDGDILLRGAGAKFGSRLFQHRQVISTETNRSQGRGVTPRGRQRHGYLELMPGAATESGQGLTKI